MDYETADGSQFSLQEVFSDKEGQPLFDHTSVTAVVDGKGFAGNINRRTNEVDDVEIVRHLKPVPPENINPPFPSHFTKAPAFDLAQHHLKTPSFTIEDSEPGRTYIADRLLNEATAYQLLMKHPHPNIASFYGCYVKNGRITGLCLSRYYCNLADYLEHRLSDAQRENFFAHITSAVRHLHSLGFAHNDVNPYHICIDADGNAALVDLDSCLPFGQPLLKGGQDGNGGELLSAAENDLRGLDHLRDILDKLPHPDDDVTIGKIDGATEAALLPSNMSPEY